MRLIKLIVPAVLIAVLALFAPHAGAQTMGEYASTTAGVGTGGGSMGAGISPSIGSSGIGGGSGTWGASGLGAGFEERAGAASASGMGADFESRAGSATSGSAAQSRWPQSQFGAGASSQFGGSADRFPAQDRFTGQSALSSSADRFPPSSLSGNSSGLDARYNALSNN